MAKNNVCVSIPDELACFTKMSMSVFEDLPQNSFHSEIEVNRNSKGQIVSVDYYSEQKDLLKRVIYGETGITSIIRYRNNEPVEKEEYVNNKLSTKYIFGHNENIEATVTYKYNKSDNITEISKKTSSDEYIANYGYDELKRCNLRRIYINSQLVLEQKYRFDILDRIVEYKDNNQQVFVKNISSQGELIYYEITDKIGNRIAVKNNFTASGYVDTQVELNGYSTTIRDTNYVDNVMLKKPYTNEDDLDLIISRLLNTDECKIRRANYADILNKNSTGIIDDNIKIKTLPISIRKRIAYNIALNIKH